MASVLLPQTGLVKLNLSFIEKKSRHIDGATCRLSTPQSYQLEALSLRMFYRQLSTMIDDNKTGHGIPVALQ